MNVLVDTNVLSLALRRSRKSLSKHERKIVFRLRELIIEDAVMLPGVVRQELLSGIRDEGTFERIRDHLRGIRFEQTELDDYETAAHCYNLCITAGVATAFVDMQICAMALRRGAEIFTTDPDFTHYAKCLPIRLLKM